MLKAHSLFFGRKRRNGYGVCERIGNLFSNPYIIQMDRFAESLKHLSETFLYLEDYKGSFTKDEIEEMFRRVSERVCTNCEKRNWCLCENRIQTCQMVCEILCTAEEFGAELNVEIKRKLQKKM